MRTRVDAVARAVRNAGGIVRSRRLVEAGLSTHDIAAAVQSGLLVRERRVWVATTDADPQLRFAARHGVVLTCVTQATRLGLWVLEADGFHVACHPHAGCVKPPKAVLHRPSPLVARDPNALVDGVEVVLQTVAACQPYEAALAVWDSALNKGLVDKAALERLPLKGQALTLLSDASPFRDSGLETFIEPRLRWMRLPIRSQVWLFGHRVDQLIGERLVLQIDGGHHVGAQRAEDIAHDAELMLRGYHVIRVTYDQVVNHWPEVQDLIMQAVAQGLHRAA
ncbi:DUF559 domain-containing protein [Microbacterium terrisoli]|uniref:DUF559 domain-containing protein n=1 Tax=Microbacterium terrisoli TaxID=3242192 RepID=UPI002804B026|nr:DUF559 domain-containing protein [Microbacterium protaetiae]